MATVYLNGKLLPRTEARVPAEDRAVLFGDGVFETLRAYGGRVLRFSEHFTRLRHSLDAIGMALPVADEDLIEGIRALLENEGLREARIRITITGGPDDGALRLRRAHPPNVLITAIPFRPLAPETYARGVALITSPFRVHDTSPLARIKTTDRLVHLMAKETALERGAYDAVFLDEAGHVLETTAANVFFASERVVYTASLDCPVLPGVTRDLVFEAARSAEVSIQEGRFPLERVLEADEAFLTGTTVELLGVRSIDSRPIGRGRPGPLRERLHRAYRELAGRELGIPLAPEDDGP